MPGAGTIQITRIPDLLDLYRGPYRHKKVAFALRKEGWWQCVSSREYLNTVKSLSRGFWKLGVRKGWRVATIMGNCPEWNFIDMALMRLGAIQVPIYPTISDRNIQFICEDADIRYVVVSDALTLRRIKPIIAECPGVRDIFSIDVLDGARPLSSLYLDNPGDDEQIEEAYQDVAEEDIATIIYTSGTTGRAKGVMLTHRNFVSNFLAVSGILRASRKHHRATRRALSVLPLCHVYERVLNYMYQHNGVSVYYIRGTDEIMDAVQEMHPDILCAVPRILEKVYDRILARGRSLSGYKRKLFFWSLRLAQQYELNRSRGLLYHVKLKVAKLMVLRKWKKAFGGRLNIIVSGGATLNERLARIYWAAGFMVMEGYGLTETSPVVAVSQFHRTGVKFGTVGPILPGVEVRIAEDGEIMVRGPNVMKGYLNRPERTQEVLDAEGWFHTGDIGMLVDNTYLKITDRKKEIFKTSGGKYIAPQVLENRFKESAFIEHIIVVGENRSYPVALIVPNMQHLQSWCEIKGLIFEHPYKSLQKTRIKERLRKEVVTINATLDHTEKIRRFALLPESWGVESGELSPTLKLRRKVILERHAGLVEAIYRGREGINA
ncbi:MAG: long-chain fatty acid--CoA ligase [Lentimicrobiaceae bacterium]|nr:long-chain fatty acid--CoA ligase [Lentimicrobiaceae bacterium]